jgi:hypothetical protein
VGVGQPSTHLTRRVPFVLLGRTQAAIGESEQSAAAARENQTVGVVFLALSPKQLRAAARAAEQLRSLPHRTNFTQTVPVMLVTNRAGAAWHNRVLGYAWLGLALPRVQGHVPGSPHAAACGTVRRQCRWT